MITVTIQVNTQRIYWEDVPKHEQSFKDWQSVSEFAYRTALLNSCEVRVEHKGNGSYYNSLNAERWLTSTK